jgi:SAM-dependent methyltransferase
MINDQYGLIEEGHVPIFEDFFRKYGKGIVLDVGYSPRDPRGNKAELADTMVGLDKSPVTLDEFSNLELPTNYLFVFGDACNMPFVDDSFDVVMMLGVYNALNMSDYRAATAGISDEDEKQRAWKDFGRESQELLLSEGSRVLKPTGRLIVSNALRYLPLETVVEHHRRFFAVDDVHTGEKRYMLIGSSISQTS